MYVIAQLHPGLSVGSDSREASHVIVQTLAVQLKYVNIISAPNLSSCVYAIYRLQARIAAWSKLRCCGMYVILTNASLLRTSCECAKEKRLAGRGK